LEDIGQIVDDLDLVKLSKEDLGKYVVTMYDDQDLKEIIDNENRKNVNEVNVFKTTIRGKEAIIREKEAIIRGKEAIIREIEAMIREIEAMIREEEAIIREEEAIIRLKCDIIRLKDDIIRELKDIIQLKDDIIREMDAALLEIIGMFPDPVLRHELRIKYKLPEEGGKE